MKTTPNPILAKILRTAGWLTLTALFFSVYVYSWTFVS